jgi:hypothetical protein
MSPVAARVMGDTEPMAAKVRRVIEPAMTEVGETPSWWRGWPVAAESL